MIEYSGDLKSRDLIFAYKSEIQRRVKPHKTSSESEKYGGGHIQKGSEIVSHVAYRERNTSRDFSRVEDTSCQNML